MKAAIDWNNTGFLEQDSKVKTFITLQAEINPLMLAELLRTNAVFVELTLNFSTPSPRLNKGSAVQQGEAVVSPSSSTPDSVSTASQVEPQNDIDIIIEANKAKKRGRPKKK